MVPIAVYNIHTGWKEREEGGLAAAAVGLNIFVEMSLPRRDIVTPKERRRKLLLLYLLWDCLFIQPPPLLLFLPPDK